MIGIEMVEEAPKSYGTAFLRDMCDIVKNKTLFFIPFFGAYMAFLVGKTEYLKQSNFAIWLLCAAIFLASIKYIHLVSQFLWAAENCRFLLNVNKSGIDLKLTDQQKTAFVEISKQLPEMMAWEDWWFRKVMLLMYIEPPRVRRRPFGLSQAAMAGCSSMA